MSHVHLKQRHRNLQSSINKANQVKRAIDETRRKSTNVDSNDDLIAQINKKAKKNWKERRKIKSQGRHNKQWIVRINQEKIIEQYLFIELIWYPSRKKNAVLLPSKWLQKHHSWALFGRWYITYYGPKYIK